MEAYVRKTALDGHNFANGHLRPQDLKLSTKGNPAQPAVHVVPLLDQQNYHQPLDIVEVYPSTDDTDDFPIDESAFPTQPEQPIAPTKTSTPSSYPTSNASENEQRLQLARDDGVVSETPIRLARHDNGTTSIAVEPSTSIDLEARARPEHAAKLDQPDTDGTPLPDKNTGRPTHAPNDQVAHMSEATTRGRMIENDPASPSRLPRAPQSPPQGQHELEQSQDDHNELLYADHTTAELRTMNLAALQNEPFDGLQRKRPHDLEPTDPDRDTPTLEADLHQALLKSDQAYQENLITNMTLPEWERAGDWFLDRFAECLKAMTEQRREKRGLTQAYEQKIAQRQREVAAHGKATDVALEQMKRNGEAVLPLSAKKPGR